MKLRTLSLLYRKELLDLFRDRRTIFTMMVMPVLLMPMSMIGTNYVMRKSREEAKVQRFRMAVQAPAQITAALNGAGFETYPAADPRSEAESKRADAGVLVTPRGAILQVNIFSDQSDMMKSRVFSGRVREVFSKLRDERLRSELTRAGMPLDLMKPFDIDDVNLAQPRKMAGSFFGGLVAFMLVVFLMNGAMYGAVDMTAGEKERRTLEILLSSAAGRNAIVLSKVAMAATMALMTGGLSVASLLLSFRMLSDSSEGSAELLSLSLDATSAALLVLTILPFGIMVAAAGVALAAPARSSREGMSYLTPIFFVTMGVGSLAYLPAFDTKPWLALVPIANFVQSFKNLLGGEWTWSTLGMQLAVNFAMAAAAVAFAVRKFNDEKILLRV